MSKKKLLIHEVFKRIKKSSEKNTKGGLASDLADYLDENLNFVISKRTLVRYYEAYIEREEDEDIDIELYILNRLSQYLDFKDYEEFTRTFEKKDEDASKTTVKIDVDNEEVSLAEKFLNVIVNITNTNSNNNEQNFKVPEFIKQNGFGIMEMGLLICLVTGNVVFSNKPNTQIHGIAGILQSTPECMYWDGSEYKLVDCNNKNPLYDHKIPVNEEDLKYFKRILRKDTLNEENAVGKTWYSKYYGDVQFFTKDGVDPDNDRELRQSTSYIVDKYAGKNADSLQIE